MLISALVAERFFGYRANSDREADFAEAGVELKATCIDRRKNGTDAAGERLVLTMIPYDEAAPATLYDSHLWHKCQKMLLVWYRRDKTIDPYDQRIEHVLLFTPPEDQLPKWRYLKGSKREPRIDKRTGHQYFYSEGSMAFPDLLENPSRTILTGEGGTGASRFKHVIQCESGRYRRLVPDELDMLQTSPKGGRIRV